jgi:hypothetical protein
MTIGRRLGLAVTLVTVTLATLAAPAAATHRRDQIFHCRLQATKLGDEITITFTVNAQFPRHDWRIRIWDQDDLVYRRVRRTNAEGNIKVVTATDDRRKRDHLEAKARDITDGTPACTVDLDV